MTQQVAVIGGGVIGSSVAYYLSQRNVNVRVVEAVSPACSASGKAGGFLALDWCDSTALGPLARKSFALHAELAQTFIENHNIDYGYRRMTTHSLTIQQTTSSEVNGGDSNNSMSLPDWVDGNVLQDRVISTPENTAQVHPRLFTEALLQQVERSASGGSIELATVTQILLEDVSDDGNNDGNNDDRGGKTTSATRRRVVGVVVKDKESGQQREIPATTLVLTLGAWSSILPTLLPTDANIHIPRITGRKVHSIIVDDNCQTTTADALFLAYRGSSGKTLEPEVYPRPDNTVYCCGVSSNGDPPATAELVTVEESAITTLTDVVASVSSTLGKNKLLAAQACYLPEPVDGDGLPLIGQLSPDVEGLYIATGHSCWGILNSCATGLGLSELIVDGESRSVDLTAFDPARYSPRVGAGEGVRTRSRVKTG